ncbi:MAG: imidazolonepropionase [Spirochaetia bacterium]|jgi:imidazolonepropionase|nr:imidazolonepropionase [Spirochaetia bacterium]
MEVDTLIINSSQLLTLERSSMGSGLLGSIVNGAVAVKNGLILETGTTSAIMKNYPDCLNVIDADGSLVLPGFVDCHTHLVFAGDRSKEMEQRLEGAEYLEILKNRGGIHSTVRATRNASRKELISLGMERLNRMAENGTTTVEIKSGYGLNEETELKMLQVASELGIKHSLDVVITYLGAHTVPEDKNRDEYVKWLGGKSLRAFRKNAEFFDIFCEEGAFSLTETKMLLEAAKLAGFKLKVHGGQFNDLGSPGIASLLGAVSVDHLENISNQDLDLMSEAGTVAVLMPGVPFFLQSDQYPEAKRFVKKGIPVALATDFNPGSCPSYSMQMMITLGVFYCGLSVTDAVLGSTINAAKAINRETEIGSIKAGKKADLIILNIKKPEEIPYYFGTNLVKKTIKNGKII